MEPSCTDFMSRPERTYTLSGRNYAAVLFNRTGDARTDRVLVLKELKLTQI